MQDHSRNIRIIQWPFLDKGEMEKAYRKRYTDNKNYDPIADKNSRYRPGIP